MTTETTKMETMTRAELIEAAAATGVRKVDARRMTRGYLMEYLAVAIEGRTAYVGMAVAQTPVANLLVKNLETMTTAALVEAAEAAGFRRADASRMSRIYLTEYLTAAIIHSA